MSRIFAVHPTVDTSLAKIVISLVADTAMIVCVEYFTVTSIAENGVGESRGSAGSLCLYKRTRKFSWHDLWGGKRGWNWCLFLLLLNLFTDGLTKLSKIFFAVQEGRNSIGDSFIELSRRNIWTCGSWLWGRERGRRSVCRRKGTFSNNRVTLRDNLNGKTELVNQPGRRNWWNIPVSLTG